MIKISFPHIGNYYIPIGYLIKKLTKQEVIIPPKITRKTIDIGSKYSPDFVCVPFKYNLGNYIEALEKGATILASESKEKDMKSKKLLALLLCMGLMGAFGACEGNMDSILNSLSSSREGESVFFWLLTGSLRKAESRESSLLQVRRFAKRGKMAGERFRKT